MAKFPTGSTKRSLASALDQAQAQAASLKQVVIGHRDRMAAGSVQIGRIFALLDHLRGSKAVLAESASRPGIAAFAQETLGDPNFDITTSFNDMMAAIDNAGAWIINNMPKDAGGYILAETFAADGARVERSFTSAQTAGLRTLLDALIATID